MDTTEIIDKNLREQLDANHVEIIDESHLHRGHKAAGGGGQLRWERGETRRLGDAVGYPPRVSDFSVIFFRTPCWS